VARCEIYPAGSARGRLTSSRLSAAGNLYLQTIQRSTGFRFFLTAIWAKLLLSQEAQLRSFLRIFILATGVLSSTSGFSQKLVDPTKVAPEYREAAEKRRAEQIMQQNCAKKAADEKVMPRERISFINNCLDAAGQK
jgi:hypothetical protein